MTTEVTVNISREHPSLPGHFPGHPVVPGVVMLGEVIDVIRQVTRGPLEILEFPLIKFVSPLSPGEPLIIRLASNMHGERTFTCFAGGRTIATGRVVCRSMTKTSED